MMKERVCLNWGREGNEKGEEHRNEEEEGIWLWIEGFAVSDG